MILQALKEYYDRKVAEGDGSIAPEGLELREFPFLIVIDDQGNFVQLEDTRELVGKKLKGRSFTVPRSRPRSGTRGHEITFLLWDHFGYVLGYPQGDPKSVKQHKTWVESLETLPECLKADPGVRAVLSFYANHSVDNVLSSEKWDDCVRSGSVNITFRLVGSEYPVPASPCVHEYVRSVQAPVDDSEEEDASDKEFGHCLITGEYGEIVRLHGKTSISKDSKSLVSFQRNSGYDSYGKEQAYNAPVSRQAEFAYTTGLNTLLKTKSCRMQIGDAVTVFWSARETEFESNFPNFFDEPPKDDPDRNVRAIQSLYRSVESGALTSDESKTKFYVLGLAPNAARIAVRFWIVDTVRGMAGKIIQHFRDMEIVHGPKEQDALSLFRLLVSTAALGKAENIPPNLAGDTMRAILEGLPYPRTLLQAAVRRIRAEHDVTYARAALIKACLNRLTRSADATKERELAVALDESNTNIGYRLGRLFATLEKIQGEANPGINATIRDRFYGGASGTPVAVFPNLMRLKNHHLAKLESEGRRIYFERLIARIMEHVTDFPPHLSLDDQGRFAIGYYHQVQDFYTRKSDKNDKIEQA